MFELPKLVFIILIAGVVWYAMRWFKGMAGQPPRRRMSPGQSSGQSSAHRAPGSGGRIEAEDLVACRVCGAYVAAGAPPCSRPDCPQRR